MQHTKAIAQDLARSKDAKEAGAKAWMLWKRFDSGPFVQTVARMLVCLYFMNLVGLKILTKLTSVSVSHCLLCVSSTCSMQHGKQSQEHKPAPARCMRTTSSGPT